jgi:hypothetical protein
MLTKELDRIPVLVIGYNRADFLSRTLEAIWLARPSNLYIVIDGPKAGSSMDEDRVFSCQKVVKDFFSTHKLNGKTYFRKENVGSAVNVLTGIMWFFSHEKFGAIIEDDCIIESTFLEYLSDHKFLLNQNGIKIISGFRPNLKIEPYDSLALTHSPLTWGWATDLNSWNSLWNDVLSVDKQKKIINRNITHHIFNFWKIGFRRSMKGKNDAWDILFAFIMLLNDYLTLVPSKNLISNIGTDNRSTNTFKKDELINIKTFPYSGLKLNLESALEYIDSNDKKIFLKLNSIKYYHAISPYVKNFINYFYRTRKNIDLLARIDANRIK